MTGNHYQFRVTNAAGNGYTIDIYGRTVITAIRKAMRPLVRPKYAKGAYIEHVDQRLNPFTPPLKWNVIDNTGATVGQIELLNA